MTVYAHALHGEHEWRGRLHRPTHGSVIDRGGTLIAVSLAEQPEVPDLLVVEPDQAMALARPLPPPESMHLVDLSDEEWDAFFDTIEHL
jgi:hypothetical protein